MYTENVKVHLLRIYTLQDLSPGHQTISHYTVLTQFRNYKNMTTFRKYTRFENRMSLRVQNFPPVFIFHFV